MRAEPCTFEVRIGICQPCQERALTAIPSSAIASKPAVTCSPEATTASYSRVSCRVEASRHHSTSRFVVPAMAETTTATSWPASTSRLTWRATLRMRSMSATDVPPNFITRRAITSVRSLQDGRAGGASAYIPAGSGGCNLTPFCSGRGRTRLILDVFLDVGVGGEAAEHVAVLVDGDAFRHFRLRIGRCDESRHLTVLDAADADALPERRVDFVARLRVGDVEDVVANGDAARPAKLFPFGDELAVGIENLDAVVGPVGDVKPAGGIHGEPMRHVEFALRRSVMAPCFDEGAVLGEFDDAVVGAFDREIAVAVGDEDVARGRDEHVRWRVEGVGAIAGDARLAQRLQQFSVGGELHHRLVLAVGDPYRAVGCRGQAVGPGELARPEACNQLARRVEFLDRRDIRAFTGFARATVEHPEAGTVAVDVDADRLAPRPAFGQLRPMFDDVIRIWRAVRIVGLDLADGQCHGAKNGRADEADTQHDSHAVAHGNSSLSVSALYCDSSTQTCAFLSSVASVRRRKCRNCHVILDRDTDGRNDDTNRRSTDAAALRCVRM